MLKDSFSADPGFQYVIDNLELMSAAGRRRLLSQPFLSKPEEMEHEYDNTDTILRLLNESEAVREISVIRHQLMQMHDLIGTLNNLKQRMVLEEIELFEIKHFAYLTMTATQAASKLEISHILRLPDLSQVFSLLDPDDTKIPHFYIYDSYHPDLPELRKKLRAVQTLIDNSPSDSGERPELQRSYNELFEQQNNIQLKVIAMLSDKLHAFHSQLEEAHNAMAYTDFLLAKATLAKEWQLIRPSVTTGEAHETRLTSIWNPRLRHRLEEQKLRYQPVDITMDHGVCLITGANMAGKTVLLKTVGIIQLLAQYGFFVPAAEAVITPVEEVLFCIGDEQNEMNGLSSFASEIIKISNCVSRARQQRLLILIDEPARTTNPVEGKAIVQALATLLDSLPSFTLVTTHYSQLGLGCRKLRVRGFVQDLSDARLTPENINLFIDYSLLPDSSDDVPQEALRIATILGCDTTLLEYAKKWLGQEG